MVLAAPHVHASPTDARVVRELERLLLLHAALFHEDNGGGMPAAWHVPATVAALRACAPLINLCRGQGAVVSRALRFLLALLGVDSEVLQQARPRARSLAPRRHSFAARSLLRARPRPRPFPLAPIRFLPPLTLTLPPSCLPHPPPRSRTRSRRCSAR